MKNKKNHPISDVYLFPQSFISSNKNLLKNCNHVFSSIFKKELTHGVINNEFKMGFYSENYHSNFLKSFVNIFYKNVEIDQALEIEKSFDGYQKNNILLFKSLNQFSKQSFDFENSKNEQNGLNSFFQSLNSIAYKYKNNDWTFALGNKFLISNFQEMEVVLPFASINLKKRINNSSLSLAVNYDKNSGMGRWTDFHPAYNSTQILASDFGLRSSISPFFLANDLKNEKNDVLSFSSKIDFNSNHDIEFSYIFTNQINTLYPIFINEKFYLKNVADIRKNLAQLSFNLFKNINDWDNFSNVKIEIIKFFGKVTDVHSPENIVYLSGFENVSNVFIKNQKLGSIYGYDYLRNSDGFMIIDRDGFPIKDTKKSIIGNSTPNFIFVLSPKISVKKFSLEANLSASLGGNVWDGTSLALDYFGVSLSTAHQRDIKDFVFPGYSLDNNPNTIKVSFNDKYETSQNKWMRYGKDGVSIDGIRSASHLLLRRIVFSYNGNRFYNAERIMKISITAENLITFASFKGFTSSYNLNPMYSSGVNYFNAPIQTSIGISLTLKL
jgi:hypothetical protein